MITAKTLLHAASAAWLITASVAAPAPAWATEQKDILVGLKSLPSLTNKLVGDVQAAIIYDPANPASKADAEGIKKIVDAGIDLSGGGKLSATLVGIGELAKLSGSKIAFVTPGLTASYTAIGAASAPAGILTITTDVDCVRAAKCVLGIVSSPSVAIYFSKVAGDAAKIEFLSGFALLVKQL